MKRFLLTTFALVTTALLLAPAVSAQPAGKKQSGKRPMAKKGTAKLTPTQIRNAAAKIDALVEQGLRNNNQKPNPTIGDTRFVRRSYISIAGRIPTLEEFVRFTKSTVPDKRSALISELLDSRGYVSNYYNFWADILRIQTKHPNLAFRNVPSGQSYIDWVKSALRTNKPYDKMVRELLVANGGLWDRNNGAVGYYFRDFGMPLDHMSNTAQIFLGTQIQCAQCHDHPFDKWKQKEFYELAAYTHGQGNMTSPKFGPFNRELPRTEITAGQQQMKLISRQAMYELGNTGDGNIKLPKDYQYENGKPNERVNAAPLYGTAKPVRYKKQAVVEKKGKKYQDREVGYASAYNDGNTGNNARSVFADWVTAKENRRFNTVIANRLWKQVMGLGLIEPVDDLRDDSTPSNPALMKHLEGMIVALDYDMKAFLQILHNTKTWQRSATRIEPVPGEAYHFEGPVLQRLSAEQLWDSLLVLTKNNVERPQPSAPSPLFELRDQVKKRSPKDYAQLAKQIPTKYGQDEANGGAIYRKMLENKNDANNTFSIEEFRKKINGEIRQLDKERRQALKRKDQAKLKTILKKLTDKRTLLAANTHFRAAEMSNPLPPNHFVRTFGGSDRTLIQNASDEASIAQVLSMLNGFVDHFVLNQRGSVLHRNLTAAKSKDEKIRVAFRSILCREPSGSELAMMRPEIGEGPRDCDNMIWALINTHEFMALQ